MIKYEYTLVGGDFERTLGGNPDYQRITAQLNILGDKGWELLSIPKIVDHEERWWSYAKRIKKEV